MKCTKKRLWVDSDGYNEKSGPAGPLFINRQACRSVAHYSPRASASIFDSAPVSRMNQQTTRVQAMTAVVYQ